jgi:hypothetical protein
MYSKNVVIQPSTPMPNFPRLEHEPETAVWEPPFERWMRLADDLLRGPANPDPSSSPDYL